jgi:GNAT superfamily N-acetyltransferase
MIIERGSKERYTEALELVRAFHKEALSEYALKIDESALISFFDKCVAQSFLLIIDNKCEGLIAGQEVISPVSGEKVFQESMWFVNEPFRKYGIFLFNKAQEILKQEGYAAIVMVALANSKTDKLVKLYEKLGFIEMERHYIRRLN